MGRVIGREMWCELGVFAGGFYFDVGKCYGSTCFTALASAAVRRGYSSSACPRCGLCFETDAR
eukprot:3878864-Alexandrium_andersonii.AAC.1